MGIDNPLLEFHRQCRGGASGRDEAIRRYGFAVPTEEALAEIARHAPGGVVELGAGTGYWAAMLHQRGVDVVAYDKDPPPSATSTWFSGTQPWHAVHRGQEEVVERHADRTLLLVWPTRNETWAADAVEVFRRAGGQRLAYVGEGPGGRTGDDRFHTLLGTIDRCYPCAYGFTDAPCVCGVIRRWRQGRVVAVPQWDGCCDRVELYDALLGEGVSGPWRRRSSRALRGRARS